jgi:type I restriction enzyme S subunit
MVPPSLDQAVGSTGFDVLRPIEIPSEWLLYAVQQSQFIEEMSQRVLGVVYPAVRPKDIRSFSIPLPPLGVQTRLIQEIEKHFTRLNASEESLLKIQTNLGRYRASILKAAIEGRLVPTEAELARAEARVYETVDRLLIRVKEKRRILWEVRTGKNRDYVEPTVPDVTDLPQLPEGWAWVSWEQIGFCQNGRLFPSSEYQETGTKLLRPGNLSDRGSLHWNAENTRLLSEDWAVRHPEHLVGPGELIMNLTAQSLKDEFLGRICLTGSDERCLLNQRLARLTPVEVSTRYLLWLFKSSIFRRFVDGLNKGSPGGAPRR